MGVAERILEFSRTVANLEKQCHGNEQATKQFLVIPFLEKLGYRNNPADIFPELPADLGEKGEKVDYAIVRDGKPVILVECKPASDSLKHKKHLSQLIGYYQATEARFGILTNGVKYRFYTDLCEPNLMDRAPFLVVDMLNLNDEMVAEVSLFAKPVFDAQKIWEQVNNRKREQRDLQTISDNIARELASPSDDLVRLLAKGVLGKGNQKQAEKKRVKGLVNRALDQYVLTQAATASDEMKIHSPLRTEEEARNQQRQQAFKEPDYSKYRLWPRLKDSPEHLSLFEALRDYARSLGEDVEVNPVQDYIGIKRNRNVAAYVKFQPDEERLLAYVKADLERTVLEKGFTELLPEGSHYGRCNLKVFIDCVDKLERAKPLLKYSYDEAG